MSALCGLPESATCSFTAWAKQLAHLLQGLSLVLGREVTERPTRRRHGRTILMRKAARMPSLRAAPRQVKPPSGGALKKRRGVAEKIRGG